MHALDGSEIEKVENFLYLEGYMNSAHDVDTRIEKNLVCSQCIIEGVVIQNYEN